MAERWTQAGSFAEVENFAKHYEAQNGIDIHYHFEGWTRGRQKLADLPKLESEINDQIARYGEVEVCPSNPL